MTTWTLRRLGVATVAAVGVVLALGVPTGLVPNPLVAADPTTPRWSLPALLAIAALSGLLLATYVSAEPGASSPQDRRRLGWSGAAGAYLAVCPTCTALVAVALGTGGAAAWLQPAQPIVALAAIGLLAEALRRRLRRAKGCTLPADVAEQAATREQGSASAR